MFGFGKEFLVADFVRAYNEDTRFVVFDVETMQGKGSENQHIVEIGAIDAGKTLAENPQKFQRILFFETDNWKQYQWSFRIHKISKEEILNGEDREKAVREFIEFINPDTNTALISHTKVDITAIKRELGRHESLKEWEVHPVWDRFYDSRKLAQILFPEIKENGGYGVANLAKYFNIINPNAHRALADSITTKKIMVHLLQRALSVCK